MGFLSDDFLVIALSITGSILLCWGLLWGYRSLRKQETVKQFRESLGILASSLREGHSFPQALTILADLGPHPLSREFRVLQTLHQQGADLSQLLKELIERFPCFEADYLAKALQCHPDEPARVASCLVRLEQLHQNRKSAKKRVESACSVSRKCLRALLLLGPLTAILFVLFQPELVLIVRSKWTSNRVMWSLLAGLLVCASWFVLILQRQDEAEIVLD